MTDSTKFIFGIVILICTFKICIYLNEKNEMQLEYRNCQSHVNLEGIKK